jgi:hypothetical protein
MWSKFMQLGIETGGLVLGIHDNEPLNYVHKRREISLAS